MVIYLAGGLSDNWQDAFKRLSAKHTVLDPRTWQHPDPKIYTPRDVEGLNRADIVLAFMSSANRSGYGMSLELGYAAGLGKKIIFVDCIQGDWRSEFFGLHRELATRVVHSADEAVDVIEAM